MPRNMTIINLACTITKLRKWGQAWKHSAESAQNAASRLTAEHERKMVEHRDAFGVRTSADAKIIEGLRQQIETLNREERSAHDALEPLVDRVVKERDGLLTQVQDQRAEIERLKLACDTYAADWDTAGKACRIRVDEYPLSSVIRLVRDDAERAAVAKRLVKEGDALRAEVAALQERLRASIARGDFAEIEVTRLRAQTSKYKVGDKLDSYSRSLGLAIPVTVVGVRTVYDCQGEGSEYPIGHSESELKEPYVEVASHDTPAGKEAAEAVVRDSQMTDTHDCGPNCPHCSW